MQPNDNPYAAPQYSAGTAQVPPRFTARQMLKLLGVCVAGGASMGMLTNAFNGAISPQFFRDVMGWHYRYIWLFAVGQGGLEGSLYSFGYGVIFLGLISVVSRRRCFFRTAMKYVALAFALTFFLWIMGGLAAISLVQTTSLGSQTWMVGNNPRWPDNECYAWVRGSIDGAVFGGLCSVLTTIAIYSYRHRSKDMLDYRSAIDSQCDG